MQHGRLPCGLSYGTLESKEQRKRNQNVRSALASRLCSTEQSCASRGRNIHLALTLLKFYRPAVPSVGLRSQYARAQSDWSVVT